MNDQAAEKIFRFIPYRKHDIAEMCLGEGKLSGQEENFHKLYRMLDSTFHFEFHTTIESLKNSYAPVDPDADTRRYDGAGTSADEKFAELLQGLLEKANYERLTQEDLNQALSQSSLFNIRLHVDFNDFEEVLLFCRGQSKKSETVYRFMKFFPRTVEFINYERVVLYIRFKEEYKQAGAGPASLKPGATILKLFQNVPRADLEMLFPNTAVRMRTIDKLMIGVPAAVSGVMVVTTKLGASLLLLGSLVGFWLGLSAKKVEIDKTAMMVFLSGIAALGGYLWKQFSSFKNRQMKFMQALTQNLYFKNLDNNAGVFHRIVNDAEEEECKEAVLAYYFLLTSGGAIAKEELDCRVEEWLAAKWDCRVDFEIDDALSKLIRLGLVKDSGGRLSAVSMDAAIRELDRQWDEYFTAPPEG